MEEVVQYLLTWVRDVEQRLSTLESEVMSANTRLVSIEQRFDVQTKTNILPTPERTLPEGIFVGPDDNDLVGSAG
jgi:hypothetical protein